MPKRNKASRGINRKDFPAAPHPGSTSYTGRIPVRTAEEGITTLLREVATFATGGASNSFVSIIDNNPSGTDNWSEYSTSWGEYRVLGVRLQFVPTFAVNTATVTTGPLVHSILHVESITSPTNLSNAYSLGDAKIGHVTRPFVREWRMSGLSESQWLPTSTPAASGLVLSTSSFNLTVGTTYGDLFVTYYVQLRNTTA